MYPKQDQLSLFGQFYGVQDRTFDEVMDASGKVREGWGRVLPHFASIPFSEIQRLRDQALRLFHQNGILFNPFGENHSHVRPWNLDLIPHVFAEEEWKFLEAGIIQRATLLNLILQDLYGPMKLVEDGHIPVEVLESSAHFLRACHGVLNSNDRYLHLYAADIGRSEDGTFCVLADRTQSLLGAGYVLENRIILSRVLPTIFQQSHVHRLAATFQSFREHLASMAMSHQDNPTIVLLSPGPLSEDYFEHKYLARYLGYPLVLGEDLTYRDDRIFVKTLSGLQVVDVVLRFVGDQQTDPLELEGSEFQGVTGLLQAWRLRHVAIANVPGTGVVENATFSSILAPLCEHLLGVPLLIPSAPASWQGDENRNKLRLSQGPVLQSESVESRSLSVRVFAFAKDESYQVMPGGLTRFSTSPKEEGERSLADSRGGGWCCKDTWIVSKDPVPFFSLLPQAATSGTSGILRTGGEVVSRVADNLFWLGRYAERAHFQARLLRSLLLLQVGESDFARSIIQSVLKEAVISIIHPASHPAKPESSSKVVYENLGNNPGLSSEELLLLLKNPSDPTTFAGILSLLYVAAQSVRDRLSNDAWRVFIQIHGVLDQMQNFQDPNSDDVLNLLDQLILVLAAFEGLASESMSRGQGWRFLEMGKRLERVFGTIALIRAMIMRPTSPNSDEMTSLQTFLEIVDGIITYRRRYHAQIEFRSVFDLILCDESNPQSIAYQLCILSDHIGSLNKSGRKGLSIEERLILEALTKVRLADISQMDIKDDEGLRPNLGVFIQELEKIARDLSEELNNHYLIHSQGRQKPHRSKI